MLVPGLRRGDGIEVDPLLGPLDRGAVVDPAEVDARRGHDRQVSRLEEAHLAGVLEQRGHVRRDEVLALPVTDDHATGVADARGDDGPRVGGRDEHERGGTFEPREHRERCVLERLSLLQLVLEQVDHDLGVGLRLERVTGHHEGRLQLLEVLDDAVVDDRGRRGAVDVRVGVLLRRPPVRRPARVPDPGGPRGRVLRDDPGEVVQLPLSPHDVEVAVHL